MLLQSNINYEAVISFIIKNPEKDEISFSGAYS